VKSAGLVFNIDDFALYGRSVYVDIERRKKDGDLRRGSVIAGLNASGVEDSSIGRRDDYITVSRRLTVGVSKEEHHKGGDRQTQCGANPQSERH
jgi:hypothetical protein